MQSYKIQETLVKEALKAYCLQGRIKKIMLVYDKHLGNDIDVDYKDANKGLVKIMFGNKKAPSASLRSLIFH